MIYIHTYTVLPQLRTKKGASERVAGPKCSSAVISAPSSPAKSFYPSTPPPPRSLPLFSSLSLSSPLYTRASERCYYIHRFFTSSCSFLYIYTLLSLSLSIYVYPRLDSNLFVALWFRLIAPARSFSLTRARLERRERKILSFFFVLWATSFFGLVFGVGPRHDLCFLLYICDARAAFLWVKISCLYL